jgi:hypothetical protein
MEVQQTAEVRRKRTFLHDDNVALSSLNAETVSIAKLVLALQLLDMHGYHGAMQKLLSLLAISIKGTLIWI